MDNESSDNSDDENPGWLGSIFDWFSRIKESIGVLAGNITQGITDVTDSIFNAVNNVLSGIGGFFDNHFNNISSFFTGIFDDFKNFITSLFIPDENYFSDKINSFSEKFPFFKSVIDTGKYIGSIFTAPFSPPKLTIDLKQYGGQQVILDFSFYEDYKVYGDIVISSILIVFFAWRVFSRLPNTINGVGYSADSVGTFDDRLQDYRDRQNGTYRIGR